MRRLSGFILPEEKVKSKINHDTEIGEDMKEPKFSSTLGRKYEFLKEDQFLRKE